MGVLPTADSDLAAARPYRQAGPAPDCFVTWPIGLAPWCSDGAGFWAEEAFAKACSDPGLVIPVNAVREAAQACGPSNCGEFMQRRGFQVAGRSWLDGRFLSLDWTDPAALHGAITDFGPAKIGVVSAGLEGRVTPGVSGWTICELGVGQAAQASQLWASLCGYGLLSTLVQMVSRRGIQVAVPPSMPADLCYAIFVQDSIGFIDRSSLMNIIGEAWVRDPTTIVRRIDDDA